MGKKFFHIMEPESSFPYSKQSAIGLGASVPIFSPSLWHITFNSIRNLRPCPRLNILCQSHIKHCMIHDPHVSFEFISPPVFFPHQLQHNNLFHAFTTLPYSSWCELWLFATRRHKLWRFRKSVYPEKCCIYCDYLFANRTIYFSTSYLRHLLF